MIKSTKAFLLAGASALAILACSTEANAETFVFTGGVQTFTDSVSGEYAVELLGASGGNTGEALGGPGAEVSGDIFLTAGEDLTLFVGRQGGTGAFGSGGGGSFVFDGTDVLAVAGGGGGAIPGSAGGPGLAGTSGGTGRGAGGGVGGRDGTGGSGGVGGGGAGVKPTPLGMGATESEAAPDLAGDSPMGAVPAATATAVAAALAAAAAAMAAAGAGGAGSPAAAAASPAAAAAALILRDSSPIRP
jgi:hypothetical protein